VDKGQPAPGADGRRAYQKPEVTRVDVVEDEVALASCKRSTSGQRNSSGFTTSGICKTSCMAQSST
jgi:hypothetical protein